jgi:hypothetical protein
MWIYLVCVLILECRHGSFLMNKYLLSQHLKNFTVRVGRDLYVLFWAAENDSISKLHVMCASLSGVQPKHVISRSIIRQSNILLIRLYLGPLPSTLQTPFHRP